MSLAKNRCDAAMKILADVMVDALQSGKWTSNEDGHNVIDVIPMLRSIVGTAVIQAAVERNSDILDAACTLMAVAIEEHARGTGFNLSGS